MLDLGSGPGPLAFAAMDAGAAEVTAADRSKPALTLALWPRQSLARDTGLPVTGPAPTNVCLAHNVGSSEEVDAVTNEARAAGATIGREPAPTFWGGYTSIVIFSRTRQKEIGAILDGKCETSPSALDAHC